MPTPADMRERYKRIAWRYRNTPGVHGLRVHTVDLVTTVSAGAQTGEGAKTVTTTPLQERGGLPPKVRWLKQEELALSELAAGSVEIGPITPDFSAGGTQLSALSGDGMAVASTFHFVITGPQHPSGAKYRLVTTTGDRALHYTIVASPVSPV